jgi:hypothetical protein
MAIEIFGKPLTGRAVLPFKRDGSALGPCREGEPADEAFGARRGREQSVNAGGALCLRSARAGRATVEGAAGPEDRSGRAR